MVVSILEKLVPLLGASTEPGQDALDSLKRLAKHIPPGSVNQAAQNNQLQNLMLKRAQMQGMAQKPQQPPQPQAQPMPQQAAA
jgi:hypothetical protein